MWALGEQSEAALDEICDTLNSEVQLELKKRLREFVVAWQASGPNLIKMMKCAPFREYGPLILGFGLLLLWCPTDGGKAELRAYPNWPELERLLGEQRVRQEGKGKPTPEVEALTLFLLLTANPLCEKLAGPCARCDRYYIKKRASQKVYCSRRCGNAATAVARTQKRIASERKDKIERAKAAMKKWKPATRLDWKHWVASKTGIDPRFLTRAVSKGDLVPPKQER
jgi:hypothetical protein